MAHYTCENLGEGDFHQLSKVSCGDVSTKCCVDQYDKFDFKKSLQRLLIASKNMKDLHHAAIVEQILLKSHPFQSTSTKQPVVGNGKKIHQYSQSVVNMYGTASRVPIYVTVVVWCFACFCPANLCRSLGFFFLYMPA
jgi:hypothetical protein